MMLIESIISKREAKVRTMMESDCFKLATNYEIYIDTVRHSISQRNICSQMNDGHQMR